MGCGLRKPKTRKGLGLKGWEDGVVLTRRRRRCGEISGNVLPPPSESTARGTVEGRRTGRAGWTGSQKEDCSVAEDRHLLKLHIRLCWCEVKEGLETAPSVSFLTIQPS